MFWIITGVVVVLGLAAAWLWDRKYGFDLSHRDQAKFTQAQGDSDATRFNSTNYLGP